MHKNCAFSIVFFAIRPNMKWYTDITEFNLRGQKLYLSPIVDGCGRDIVAYNISRRPNLQQVLTMLDDAFKVNDSLNGDRKSTRLNSSH